jgi:hypothetical protein
MNQQEFLDEIEDDIVHIADGYYSTGIDPIMVKIKNYLDDRKMVWHPARRLPTPRIHLKLRLDTGEIVEGWRPSYIASCGEDDLGYRTANDEVLLNVVEWSIA